MAAPIQTQRKGGEMNCDMPKSNEKVPIRRAKRCTLKEGQCIDYCIETGQRVTQQWVPAHCGIPGNERGDEPAREAASLPQKVPAGYAFDDRGHLARTATWAWRRIWSCSFFKRIWGGGGTGCQGRSPARTERRWWILISCGPATGVGQGSTSTGPAATPRRRAPGVATRGARRHSSSCAGKRQTCRKTCCSDARAWQKRALDYSAPSTWPQSSCRTTVSLPLQVPPGTADWRRP